MPNNEVIRVLKNIGILAVCPDRDGQDELGMIADAVIIWEGDTILWVGSKQDFETMAGAENPDGIEVAKETDRARKTKEAIRSPHSVIRKVAEGKAEIFDADGRVVIPGLIDCHTHLVFGGWREDEFSMRSLGRSYEDIAAAGGGILNTVRATRAATGQELFEKSVRLLEKMMALGVTTVECKSGYGLSLEHEMKQLHVCKRLASVSPVRIVPTLLGAHAIPPEYDGDRAGYVNLVCREMIPAAAENKLAKYCDVFADGPAFTNEEAERIFQAGLDHGLKPKLHADQLASNGGAELAARMGAVSADHLECISDEGIAALAESDTVAVSLPLATYYLRKKPLPARRLMDAGVPVAVSTDFNPGSAPSYHLPLAMHLACTLQAMSPAEVIKGATLYAARALELENITGSIERGKKADFVELDTPSVNHWLSHFEPNCAVRVWAGGEII